MVESGKFFGAIEMRYLIALVACFLSFAAHAATLTITAEENGGDVIFTASGSLDFGALAPTIAGFVPPAATGQIDAVEFTGFGAGFPFGAVPIDVYDVADLAYTNPLGMPASGFVTFGDSFGLFNDPLTGTMTVSVTAGYNSNDPLSFTWIFAGQTFDTLGVPVADTVFATFGDNVIELVRGNMGGGGGPVDPPAGAIPLPASGLLLAGVFMMGTAVGRRRHQG